MRSSGTENHAVRHAVAERGDSLAGASFVRDRRGRSAVQHPLVPERAPAPAPGAVRRLAVCRRVLRCIIVTEHFPASAHGRRIARDRFQRLFLNLDHRPGVSLGSLFLPLFVAPRP